MSLHDLLTGRQAHTRPRVVLSCVQPLEDRKDLLGVLHVHADAVIFYGKLGFKSASLLET